MPGPLPRRSTDLRSHQAPGEIVGTDMDPAVEPRYAGLIGRIGVGRPLQGDIRIGTRLKLQRICAYRPFAQAAGEELMLPVKAAMTSAEARLKVLCPDTYPANDGVTKLVA